MSRTKLMSLFAEASWLENIFVESMTTAICNPMSSGTTSVTGTINDRNGRRRPDLRLRGRSLNEKRHRHDKS
ncbi:MAG: hypothetical protein HZC38_00735 [Chloroflexi bacterium]|nr:hypothetical protein [Chloroflexota bacterium]